MKTSSHHNYYYPEHIRIYESELRAMCGLAAMWGQIETGGDLFGLYTRNNCVTCLLSTGPGVNATHEKVHFAQDLEFCRRAQDVLDTQYGLEWVGTWHSHHDLGLDGPSSGDVQRVMGVSSKNNLDTWCEMILTLNNSGHSRCSSTNRASAHINQDRVVVKVNPFVYTDPQNGKKTRTTVHVLPGISPIRQSLLANAKLSPFEIAEYASCFPVESILIESALSEESGVECDAELPKQIISQIVELPPKAQELLDIFVRQEQIVVAFPLTKKRVVEISLCLNPPYGIETIHLLKEGVKPKDITKHINTNGEDVRLAQVYQVLASMAVDSTSTPVCKETINGIMNRFWHKGRTSLPSKAAFVYRSIDYVE